MSSVTSRADTGNLLFDERILIVQPSLVALVGIVPALLLQQIHFLTRYREAEQLDGHWWIAKSYPEWTEHTGLTRQQVRTAMDKLIADKLIITTKKNGGAVIIYRIDHEELAARGVASNHEGCCQQQGKGVSSNTPTLLNPLLNNKTPDAVAPVSVTSKSRTKKKAEITAQQEKLRPIAQRALAMLRATADDNGVARPPILNKDDKEVEDAIILQVWKMDRTDKIDYREFLPALDFGLSDDFWQFKILSPAAWREVGSGETHKFWKINAKWKEHGRPGIVATAPADKPKFVPHPRELDNGGR